MQYSGFFQKRLDPDLCQGQLHLSGFYLREIEYVINEGKQVMTAINYIA